MGLIQETNAKIYCRCEYNFGFVDNEHDDREIEPGNDGEKAHELHHYWTHCIFDDASGGWLAKAGCRSRTLRARAINGATRRHI